MKKEIEIFPYDSKKGVQLKWETDFCISVKVEYEAVTISADKGGLISLARHLLTLAQDEVPQGVHFHLDEYSALEDGSIELIVERM